MEIRETHISRVYLGEREVWKTKLPVRFPFLDYSTPELRRHYCEEEVRLNRRLAPGVYLGVVPFEGEPAVHMRRLPDEASAAWKVRRHLLDFGHMEALAQKLARFYASAPEVPNPIRRNLQDNFAETEPFVGTYVDRRTFEEVREWQLGFGLPPRPSRDGHGDLRLEHAYFLDEGPVVIDCIEFNERFRHGDPACDVAFLAMELDLAHRRDLSSWFLTCFARETNDFELFGVVDLYLSYRAWVRGKVECLKGRRSDHFRLALDYAQPGPGRVIAVGGVIGSGKTTLAEALAKRMACPVLSTDRLRDPGDYGERAYEEMFRLAKIVTASGRGVVLDATFRSAELRRRARELSDSFLFVEARCPEEILERRLLSRPEGKWLPLLPVIRADFEPVDPELPHVTVDTNRTIDAAVEEVLDHLCESWSNDRT